MALPVLLREVVGELAVRQRRRLEAGVGARLVERDGVEGGEHADVRQDGGVVLAVAVAVRRDVAHDVDVEAGTVLADCLRVLRHLAVEEVAGIPLLVADRVEAAGADAAAAALAEVLVDVRLIVFVRDGIGAAFLRAFAAAAAEILIDDALARGVLLHLARAAAAAHADVLERAAEACRLMPLEMGEADEDVGVHDGAADLRFLDILAVLHRDRDVVRALEPVADDDLAARCDRVEAVEVRAVHVLERVLAAAGVERVAVREERAAALRLHEIGDGLRVLRTQESEVAEFAEMHLDGDEFVLHVDVLDARGQAETFQLVLDARADGAAEIREVDFRFAHLLFLLSR